MPLFAIIRICIIQRSLRSNLVSVAASLVFAECITVTDVLEYLAGGMTQEEIVTEFPDLTAEDIRASLAFAADRERKLATLPHYETAV